MLATNFALQTIHNNGKSAQLQKIFATIGDLEIKRNYIYSSVLHCI